MTSPEPEVRVTYAWCFSHGRMHVFRPSIEYPDGAWCGASWVPLAAKTEHEALAEKIERFGEDPFCDDALHHVQVCELRDAWKAEQVAATGLPITRQRRRKARR